MLKGNLIDLAEQANFNLIVHGCNCFHTMGSGIAEQIRLRYPQAYAVDVDQTVKGDKNKLGRFTYTVVQGPLPLWWKFTIVNAYTQYNYGRGGPHLDYNALRSVFRRIRKDFPPATIIGYPKIGAGLGGGNWQTIQQIIDEELNGMTHQVVTLK